MADKNLKTGKDPYLYHLPPQNLEAEESILSSILVDNNTLLEICLLYTSDAADE